MIKHKFDNGDRLKDKVTGLEGIVMVIAKYATGCLHYGIQTSQMKDGEPIDWIWLDESRFELMEKRAVVFNIEQRPSGPSPVGPSM